MYKPGETQNKKCIDLTERRSFYRKMNDTKLTHDNKYKLQKNNNLYNKTFNYNIKMYILLCNHTSVKPKTICTCRYIDSMAYNAISSVDMIKSRIMAIHFQVNPQTTVISCYSPTNVSDKQDTEIFYTDLTYCIRHIPKHNVLINGGDFNAHLGKDDGYKYSLHRTTNRNGKMLHNFRLCLNTLPENIRTILNTHIKMALNHKLIS